ncbi:MAG: glycosyltransferase family 2 protein [Aquaspirillum sp.]
MKINIIAVAKDEAAYIPLWVFHHLYFGFDEIEIILNRTSDNSERILKLMSINYPNVKYSKCDWIDLLNSNVSKNLQNIAYAQAYAQAKDSGFTHVFFIDIDEFWVSSDFRKKIKDFIKNFDADTSISFQWACELGLSEKFSLIQEKAKYVLKPHVKTLISCLANVEKIRVHCPSLMPESPHVLANGENFISSNKDPQICQQSSVGLMSAFLIHRMYRSELEYMSTLLRGNPQSNNLEFKKNRDGFHIDHKNKILLSFDSDSYAIYKKLYEDFCQFLKINEEIKIAEEYVLNRSIDAIRFVKSSIEVDLEGTKKILSGVNILGVVRSISEFQSKINPLGDNINNVFEEYCMKFENEIKVNAKKTIKISEIVQTLRASSPELLGQLPDQRLVAIIGAALAQVAAAVRDTEEGPVQVPRLGRFAVRQVLHKPEGKEAEVVKRVVFHPAPTAAMPLAQGVKSA